MSQLYLDFNTIDSTEDRPCTIQVDSVEHAKTVLHYIGRDRIQFAEVYDIHHDDEGEPSHYTYAVGKELRDPAYDKLD